MICTLSVLLDLAPDTSDDGSNAGLIALFVVLVVVAVAAFLFIRSRRRP